MEILRSIVTVYNESWQEQHITGREVSPQNDATEKRPGSAIGPNWFGEDTRGRTKMAKFEVKRSRVLNESQRSIYRNSSRGVCEVSFR